MEAALAVIETTISVRETSLGYRIMDVFFLRADAKVFRVNAKPLVATVKNDFPPRDWAVVGKYPGHAMGALHSALNPNMPVSSYVACACPQPAIVLAGTFHFRIEPFA